MFRHLERLVGGDPDRAVASSVINTFAYMGEPFRLVVQPGIWKPAGLSAALTIRTTFTPLDQIPPYVDSVGADGLIRYKYQGTDPHASDNRALREAMLRGLPLAYFVGVAKGVYIPRFPVKILAEDPVRHEFAIAVDETQTEIDLMMPTTAAIRRYVERMTKIRVHQPVFRAQVLRAYNERCAMCHLGHTQLLDAAHIVPDGQPHGDPVVPNGLSLCKIHHAAFDVDILGIRPDLVIEVRDDILHEHDGPMLHYGLQGLEGQALTIPQQRLAQPDPVRLAVRYDQFRAAS